MMIIRTGNVKASEPLRRAIVRELGLTTFRHVFDKDGEFGGWALRTEYERVLAENYEGIEVDTPPPPKTASTNSVPGAGAHGGVGTRV